MNWTKTPPTKPGAYWWRAHSEHVFPKLFEVWASGQVFGDTPGRTYDKNNPSSPEYASRIGGEWCGPLVPVEEVEKAFREGFQDGEGDNVCNEDFGFATSQSRKIVQGELLP